MSQALDERDREEGLGLWLTRASRGLDARRPFEMPWQLSQAFVQGRQWVGWDKTDQRVVDLPNPHDRVRHTVNVITGFFETQQGKLLADDIKPDVTFRRDDVEGQSVARVLQKVYDYCWDEEWDAKGAYVRASIKRLTYGLGALRCRYDAAQGEIRDKVPFYQGEPADQETLDFLTEHGMLPDGSLPKFKTINEGRTCWEPLGPMNLIPPPGLEHESLFPWLIIHRPATLESVKGMFPETAADLREETIRQVDSLGATITGGDQPTPRSSGELREHVMLFTGYQLPTVDRPQGQTVHWAGKKWLNGKNDPLPVQVKGRGKIGIAFLKYHVVDDRFWPLGLVEPCIGPQRQRNISRSQNIEVKDRLGLGRIYSHENAYVETKHPEGLPAEMVVIRAGYEFPKETQGTGPGPWLKEEADMNDNDLRQVVGLGDISLSQVPSGVSAYSAFALLVDQDDRRIGPVRAADRAEISQLVKTSFEFVRRYWPEQRLVPFLGENQMMDAVSFAKATLPLDVYTRIADSAPLPKGQAAEAQLIFDVFDRGIGSGQALPLDWLYESLRAMRMQPLPKRELKVQEQAADYENMLMAHGQQVQPREYDNDELHVQRHRAAQSAYQVVAPSMPQFQSVVQLIETHIQAHLQSAQQKALLQAQSMPNGIQQAPSQGQGGQNAGLGPLAAASGQPTAA